MAPIGPTITRCRVLLKHHKPLTPCDTRSAIVRATSKQPNGPFAFAEVVIGPPQAHNPTIRQMPNGDYILFFISTGDSHPKNCSAPTVTAADADATAGGGSVVYGGIYAATAPSMYGPWGPRVLLGFTNTSYWLHGGFTNPSPSFHANGSVTLAFQAQAANTSIAHLGLELVGVAVAPSWRGPYEIITPQPVIPEKWYCMAGTAEDPYLVRMGVGVVGCRCCSS